MSVRVEKITLPHLFAQQEAIIKHPARFKVLCCGRRFSKTTIAIDLCAARLIRADNVAYFAPTFRMLDEVWMKIETLLAPLIRRSRRDEYRLDLSNGGVFECWSTGNETVRGRAYHFAVLDEAALIPTADYWQAAVRPLLTDYQGGALFCSTPRGRNWFWDIYNLGLGNHVDWNSWTFPTAANPYIRLEEVEAAAAQLPERVFKQEYLAEFLDDGGAVFRGIDLVCTGDPLPGPQPGETYYMGIDWARDEDFTVISVAAGDGRQVYIDRFNQISYNIQRDRIRAIHDRFKPSVILAESNSIGTVNIEALQQDGLPVRPFYTTHTSKATLIEALVLAIEKQQITLLNHPILKSELQAFQMQRAPNGSWYYSAPPGAHDDCVIATALSNIAARNYGRLHVDFA